MQEPAGRKAVRRLKEFTEALESGDSPVEKFTCRKVELDLHPQVYGSKEVKDTRRLLGLSQPLFAKFLGCKLSTLQKWERGENVPSDVACRFMDEVRRDPEFWRNRIRESARITTSPRVKARAE